MCSGKTVLEFTNGIQKRAAKYGLRLVQVPEYFSGNNLSIHSFLTTPFLSVPSSIIMPVLELSLLERFSFIADRERATNWPLTLPWMKDIASMPTGRTYAQNSTSGDPQYFHYTGDVAIRVFSCRGFAFITNRLRKVTSSDTGQALFHAIRTWLRLCEAVNEGLEHGLLERLEGARGRSVVLWGVLSFL